MKTAKLRTVAASSDVVTAAKELLELSLMGQEVLRQQPNLGKETKASVQRDVCTWTLDSLERWVEGHHYHNARALMEQCTGVVWWSEEERLGRDIAELWLRWRLNNKGNAVEAKARDLLNFAKNQNWRKTAGKAAQLLGALNRANSSS